MAAALAQQMAQQMAIGQTAEELAQLDQQACPVCGITFYEFRSQGRLGCPHDYVAFKTQLEPLILNIHGEGGARGQAAAARAGRQRAAHPVDPPPPRDEGGRSRTRSTSGPRNSATRSAASKPSESPADGAWRAVELNDLAQSSGEWLRGTGPEADIVISSRIRLARNLADFPFISRATPQDRAQIERLMRECVLGINTSGDLLYVAVDELEGVDRQFLVERHLISREHAESQGRRAVAIDRTEKFSLMINEEDHLRMQVMQSGLNLQSVWEQINRIDDLIEEQVTYAFHEQLGYLTACPTNVGTGMRVSVMLHLPALVITRQIEKVFRSLQKISLAVRGLYGEGSQAMGDFYQISNQITLGRSEEDLIQQVGDIVPVIIDYERQARAVPHQGEPREPARPREPGLRHPPHRPDDQLRRDDAPALQRADGGEPGPDPGPGDPRHQRAVHPHAAGPPAEDERRRAGHAPTATSSAPATSASTSTARTARTRRRRTEHFGAWRRGGCATMGQQQRLPTPTPLWKRSLLYAFGGVLLPAAMA